MISGSSELLSELSEELQATREKEAATAAIVAATVLKIDGRFTKLPFGWGLTGSGKRFVRHSES